MIDKRLLCTLPALALLAACGDGASDSDGRAASGEVLEGTISDAMLPVDRVRSEPPLEDPEAFAKARSAAAEGAGDAPEGEDSAGADEEDADGTASPTPEVTPAIIED